MADTGPAAADLAPIEKPADLARLDAAVQRQFAQLWQEYEAAQAGGNMQDKAKAVGKLGQLFDVYGYAESAWRAYGNAALLDPREPRWPYYLGRLKEEAGELEEAEADYGRAAMLSQAGDQTARLRLADLALRQQNLDLAGNLYAEISAAEPANPGALLGKGRLALLRGDAAAAIEPLERLLRLQPEAMQVHYSLGLAYRQLGQEKRAAEELAKVPAENLDQIALELGAPWDIELQALDQGARTLTQRGVRAFRRGDNTRAAIFLGRAVEAEPKGPEKRINYALVLFELGYAKAATQQLAMALELAGPGSEMAAKAHLELGRMLAAWGRPAAALPHLEAALAIDPQSMPAHIELGRLLHNQGKLAEALPHYAAVRVGTKPLAASRFWHAALLIQLGRNAEAKKALEEDLAALGDNLQIRLVLARLLATTTDEGLRDVARARALLASQPTTPDVFFAETAAMVAAAEGRFPRAIAWQEAAVAALAEVKPRQAVHIARRRLVLYQRGEPCRTPWEGTETPLLKPVQPPPHPSNDE